MLLKSKIKSGGLLKEGSYEAVVSSVRGKPDEINPKKIILGFKSPDTESEVFKELSTSMEHGAPLRRDLETLLAKQLTEAEAQAGVNPATVLGKKCQIVVALRGGPGGKPTAVVSVVLPATAAEAKSGDKSNLLLKEPGDLTPKPKTETAPVAG